MDIPLGEWLPDQPSLNNPGVLRAENVLPTATGYKPFPGGISTGASLAATCKGAIMISTDTSGVYTFAGDSVLLYRATGLNNFVDVSSGPYANLAQNKWMFSLFGKSLYAASAINNTQRININVVSAFSDLLYTAFPRSKYIATVKDFNVLANVDDPANVAQYRRVWWSGKGNPEVFPTPGSSAANQVQSDYQDLESDGGIITGLVGGEYGIVFQENAIWKMIYEGPPTFFRFEKIGNNIGCRFPWSFTAYGNDVYFISKDGFCKTNGFSVTPIGIDRVDNTFHNEFDRTYSYLISACVGVNEPVVYWSIPTIGSSGVPSKIYCYNIALNKWSSLKFNHNLIFKSLRNYNTSTSYSRGVKIAYLGTDNLMYISENYTTPLTSIIETAEVQPADNRKTRLKKLKVHSYGGTITTDIGIRESTQAAVTYPSNLLALPTKANGETDVRANSKYYRFRINTSGDFGEINKVNLTEFSPGPTR